MMTRWPSVIILIRRTTPANPDQKPQTLNKLGHGGVIGLALPFLYDVP